MLAASFKILSGEFKNQRLFMNRVLYGTKNDGNMIKSAVGWLNTLESGVVVSFEGYKQFNQLVLDVAEAIDGTLEYDTCQPEWWGNPRCRWQTLLPRLSATLPGGDVGICRGV